MEPRTQPAPGTTVSWLGATYTFLLTAAEAEGRFSAHETACPPNAGPPRHIHLKEDETFYVLEGEVVFWLDGTAFRRGPGEIAFVPRGREHTFQIPGDTPARFLTMLTPGGFEDFFLVMAERPYRIPEDMPEVTKIARRYNLEFTGPPLAL